MTRQCLWPCDDNVLSKPCSSGHKARCMLLLEQLMSLQTSLQILKHVTSGDDTPSCCWIGHSHGASDVSDWLLIADDCRIYAWYTIQVKLIATAGYWHVIMPMFIIHCMDCLMKACWRAGQHVCRHHARHQLLIATRFMDCERDACTWCINDPWRVQMKPPPSLAHSALLSLYSVAKVVV